MQKHLSKADFFRWITCPASAYYGWSGFQSKNDNDAFLQFLANEGKTVGRVARSLFASGRFVEEKKPERADSFTRAYLQADCTLFEACIIQEDFVIRPDILIRKGKKLYVIEVKSKLGNLRQHQEGKMLINCYGDIRAAYREIVYDLSFQVEVLQRAYPNLLVVPYFLLPEERSPSRKAEVLAARDPEEAPLVQYDRAELKTIRAESVLKFFSADTAVEKIRGVVAAEMRSMAEVWKSGEMPKPVLKYGCRNCEFRLKGQGSNEDGFHNCWGSLAKPSPHLFDLHQLYSLKTRENKQALLADEKISFGKTSLFDVSREHLHGEHAKRQSLQLKYQRSGGEWIDPRLGDAISTLSWPIAFVDFETTMAAIPWHVGLKPYETLPFQFSAHILHKDGRYEHREWLNLKDRVPTLPFIQNLKASLEDVGNVMVYTDYENRILSEAIGLLKRLHGDDSKEERQWIADLLNSGRIVDQHDWVYKYHFHPKMSGRTSIKVVQPAVWQNNPNLHYHSYFKRYFLEQNGEVIDPYKTLPEATISGIPFAVREGCGAMKIYREMILGQGAQCSEAKETLAALLRNYVTLDTASQWMIFEHWRQRLS